ncbi:unnamed protein product [Adineta steineri]|uniref:Uncharacterized protein n=1 Tax=Adineta steineri TaxID=433720 RepID=A0A819EB10_9BILA|nr:unnamed protein product [Adineta steineri]CAF3846954.1 unnamed protein product [Adineta steineri]
MLHEVFNVFSNLNSRFAAIMDNLSLIPVYLGLNGMSIAATEFYYRHLSQLDMSSRLISLCASDTLAISNGFWLVEHVSTFINLRHLSLIDIQRCSFELILNSLSPINSLIVFRVSFSNVDRAADTFLGVPEGVYYERIFHVFPSLRDCQLLFKRYIHSTVDSEFVLPPNRTFMPVQIGLLNLRSLTIYCSPSFLSHLFEHVPQLEKLNYKRTDLWLPTNHPLRHSDYKRTPWPDNGFVFNNQLIRCDVIIMSEMYDRMNDEFLSFSPPIVPWHQVTTLSIAEPFNRNHLHLLFSQATNLRTLELHYRLAFDTEIRLKEETLIDLLSDNSLCDMLTSNGLRQLNLFMDWKQPNLLDIAYSIVERLPHLQVIQLNGWFCEIIEVAHILINGLANLSFLILDGFQEGRSYDERLRDLQNSNTRSFRTEIPNTETGCTLLVWL